MKLPSGCGRTPATCDVVLVGDVADDLLEDVLERDDAHQRAVLVDHEGEMLAPAAEGLAAGRAAWCVSG